MTTSEEKSAKFAKLTQSYPDNSRDEKSPRWDMSQERMFLENLLGQRFNFLLVFFSIIVAGAVQAREWPLLQAVVVSLGAVIAFCLMLAIGRTQEKLDIALGLLFSNPTHPAAITDTLAIGRSRRKLVGYIVPQLCSLVLFAWTVVAWIAVYSEYRLR